MPELGSDLTPEDRDLVRSLTRYGDALESLVPGIDDPRIADAPSIASGPKAAARPGRWDGSGRPARRAWPLAAAAALAAVVLAGAVAAAMRDGANEVVQGPVGSTPGSSLTGPTGSSLGGPTGSGLDAPAPGWERIADGPLAPRSGAAAVGIGSEVFVIGGGDGRPCPPNADCGSTFTSSPLRDGAAFDVHTRQWRRIASAPHPVAPYGAVAGTGRLYVRSTPVDQGAEKLMAYDVAGDSWSILPDVPRYPTSNGVSRIAASGDDVVVATSGIGYGEDMRLWRLQSDGSWTELPERPLRSTYGSISILRDTLVVLDADPQKDNSARGPRLTRAQFLDLPSGTWSTIGDSDSLDDGGGWFPAPGVLVDGEPHDLLVNPNPSGADGGETNGFGRTIPFGGILDVTEKRWIPLPALPEGTPPRQQIGLGWAETVVAGRWALSGGWALDLEERRWVQSGWAGPDAGNDAVSVAGADGRVLVWGGTRWSSDGSGRFETGTHTTAGYLWTPPTDSPSVSPDQAPTGPDTSVPSDPTTIEPGGPDVEGRSFLAIRVTVDGVERPLPEAGRISLAFGTQDGALNASWSGGCNSTGGPVRFDGDRLLIGDPPFVSTLIGCPPDRQADDDFMAGLLASTPTFTEGDVTWSLSSGSTIMTMAEVAVDPEPASVTSTTWRLAFVTREDIGAEIPGDAGLVLTVSDDPADPGRLRFRLACAELSGTVVLDRAGIDFTVESDDDLGCPAMTVPVTEAIVAVLRHGAAWNRQPDRLLIQRGLHTLTFVPA